MKNEIKLFEQSKIRSVYDEENDIWYFSVVDVIAILIEKDYQTARKYWNKLAERLRNEGANEPVTNCHQLKMKASDGKMRETDAATAETMLRIVQSVPSPKAEPIKQWLARVGYERMKETADPALSLNRARENWQRLGYSEKWIQQRMTGQETRNKLTDYWKTHEITKDEEYAILTNIIHREWSGLSVSEHKKLKGLKSQNLRDHMSEAELIFTALAELSTRQYAENVNATGMKQNVNAAHRGGKVAKNAKENFEKELGVKVITKENFLPSSRTKELQDIADCKEIDAQITSKKAELFPASVVNALINGENPIKTFREFRNLTQAELAQMADLSLPMVKKLESAQTTGSVKTLKAIAKALKVDVEDIM